MFSGIVCEIGKIKSVSKKGSSARIEVSGVRTGEGIKLGESIAVNGVCLTVVSEGCPMAFDVVGNTLKGSNLKRLKAGDEVNLENALKMGDTISGHMVTGHVDGERQVKGAKKTDKGWALDIGLEEGDERYLVPKGAIAIDGVSLTVGEISPRMLRIFLIPHTLETTTLKSRMPGDRVNVEFDMAAKYASKRSESVITKDFLREKGFL